MKTSASAEEEAGDGCRTNRPSSEGRRSFGAEWSTWLIPDSGASQLRDSAGFAPDFAAFAPAGDMCPATRAYAITTTRPRAHGEPADAQRRAAGSLAGAAGAIRARQRSGVVQADVIGTLVTLSERERRSCGLPRRRKPAARAQAAI